MKSNVIGKLLGMGTLLTTLLGLSAGAQAQFTIPGVELVETIPVETNLGFADTRDTVAVWCEMFNKAREEIVFGQFYISAKPGEAFDKVFDCLNAAGKRGVKIRFLYEGGGTFTEADALARLEKVPGIVIRKLAFKQLHPSGIIHAKYLVVDKKTAFLGSANFDWRAMAHIHETGVMMSDPHVVAQVQSIFDFDWAAQAALEEGKTVAPTNTVRVPAEFNNETYLVASPNDFNPPGVADSETEVVRLINGATKEIRILLYEYAPLGYGVGGRTYYGVIDTALRTAAARGVKIKLMTEATTMNAARQPYMKSLAMLPNVEIRLVTIPVAKVGPIPFARLTHSKTMSIDGKIAWVGTSNWSGGYLDNSRNLELVMRNDKMAARVAATHEQMWSSVYAAPLDINKDYAPSKK